MSDLTVEPSKGFFNYSTFSSITIPKPVQIVLGVLVGLGALFGLIRIGFQRWSKEEVEQKQTTGGETLLAWKAELQRICTGEEQLAKGFIVVEGERFGIIYNPERRKISLIHTGTYIVNVIFIRNSYSHLGKVTAEIKSHFAQNILINVQEVQDLDSALEQINYVN